MNPEDTSYIKALDHSTKHLKLLKSSVQQYKDFYKGISDSELSDIIAINKQWNRKDLSREDKNHITILRKIFIRELKKKYPSGGTYAKKYYEKNKSGILLKRLRRSYPNLSGEDVFRLAEINKLLHDKDNKPDEETKKLLNTERKFIISKNNKPVAKTIEVEVEEDDETKETEVEDDYEKHVIRNEPEPNPVKEKTNESSVKQVDTIKKASSVDDIRPFSSNN